MFRRGAHAQGDDIGVLYEGEEDYWCEGGARWEAGAVGGRFEAVGNRYEEGWKGRVTRDTKIEVGGREGRRRRARERRRGRRRGHLC